MNALKAAKISNAYVPRLLKEELARALREVGDAARHGLRITRIKTTTQVVDDLKASLMKLGFVVDVDDVVTLYIGWWHVK